jgi:hypothetical protein
MSRELDAKVADKVFGMRVEFYESENYDPMSNAPSYTTDTAADYEVLRRVREKWSRAKFKAFVLALDDLWDARIGDKHESPGQWACMYEPGDWSRAALKALGEEIG